MKLNSLKLISNGLFSDEPMGVLVDTRKCVGCKACTISCKLWNDNKRETETFKTETSANTYAVVTETEVVKNGKLEYALVRKQCMHCVEPWCESACPTGAIYKTKDGPVLYDASRCLGCKYCVQSCPYGAPHFDEEEKVIKKCVFCYDRISLGLEPACVGTCITGALEYGVREELVAKAKAAMGEGHATFGVDDGGGTSFIYILQKNIEPKDVGFPELGSATPTDFKLNMLQSTTGIGGATVALSLAGIAAAKYMERRKVVSESMKKGETERKRSGDD